MTEPDRPEKAPPPKSDPEFPITATGDMDRMSLEGDELARADREAAEALRTGAMSAGTDTMRLSRDEITHQTAKQESTDGAASGGSSPDAGPAEAGSLQDLVLKELLARESGQAAAAGNDAGPSPEPAPVAPSPEATPATPAASPEPAPATPAAAPATPAAEAAPEPAPAASDSASGSPLSHIRTAEPSALPAGPWKREGPETTRPTERLAAGEIAAAASAPEPRSTSSETTGALAAATPAAPVAHATAEPATAAPPPKKPPAPRAEEDDRLLAAIIFLDAPYEGPQRPPSPFATIGGTSLISRAAASVRQAGVERVIFAGKIERDTLEKAREEFATAGWKGSVEEWSGAGPPPVGDRGRILILDAAGVHDPNAVARLARWKGESACVLVAKEGEGLRVQVENGKVRELGTSLVPFDGVTCGAVNVPIPLFPRLAELGAMGALLSLANEGLLGASIERHTFAREITSETGLSDARNQISQGVRPGTTTTLLDRVLIRKVSRPLARALAGAGVPALAVTLLSGIVALAGLALMAWVFASQIPQLPMHASILAGAVLLVLSAVLDSADDEVAAIKAADSQIRRLLDVSFDGIVAMGPFLALAHVSDLMGVQGAITRGATAGGAAAIAAILAVVARHGREEGSEPGETAGKAVWFLAARIKHREIGYVLLPIAIANFVLASQGYGTSVYLGWAMWGLAFLAYNFAFVFLVLTIAGGFLAGSSSTTQR